MPTLTGLAPKRAASPIAHQPGDDPRDPQARARATRAAQARNASGRRRLVDPATCDRDYPAEELEFMQAMHKYRQSSGRMFPTWSEVLEVLQGLGYSKVAE